MTGETVAPCEPKLISEAVISEPEFNKLLSEVEALELEHLPSQDERIAYTHFDDWYGFKREVAETDHWLGIAGGKYAGKRGEKLLELVYTRCKRLFSKV